MNKETNLLGIDLGTTGCKSMVFDLEGNILGKSYIEYELIFTADGVEQDAELWWKHVCGTAREAAAQAGGHIAALSVSAQGIAGVPTANGVPLMNALSWLDNRSVREMQQLCELYGEERLFAETGKYPGPYTLPQVMWLKAHRPDVFHKMDQYLMPMEFILRRMTGTAMTDYSMACGTMAYHIGEKRWMDDLLMQTLGAAVFAPVGCMGQKVGTLLPDAAKELGLGADTIVALGGQDQKCAALGAGIGPGVATVSLGTSAAMCSLSDAVRTDERRVVTCCGMDDTHWIMETTVNTAGLALKWLKNTFFEGATYDDLSRMAEQSPPGASGVLFFPQFSVDGAAAGTFTGIGMSATKQDMVRAVMEGVACLLAAQLAHHERLVGPIREIHMFGGGALSGVWRQILADMADRPVALSATHETGCLGAAILAAKGAGLIEDIYTPGNLVKEPMRIVRPNAGAGEVYRAKQREYEAIDHHITNSIKNAGGLVQ